MMQSLGDVDETFADLRLIRFGHQERSARLFRTMGWILVPVIFIENNISSAVSSWSYQRKAGPQLRSGNKSDELAEFSTRYQISGLGVKLCIADVTIS